VATADPRAGGSPVQTGYAPVNGLSMYCEIRSGLSRRSRTSTVKAGCCLARPVIQGMTWSAARPGRVLPIMIF
jgi:hypothetical protein